jgi:hypothetical protein
MMKPPPVGTVRDGYRFNGGDPANPASWSRATSQKQSADTAQWPANARVLPNNKVVVPNGKGGVIQLGDLNPNPTEFAGKSAMFANLMQGAEGQLNQIEATTGKKARTLGDVVLGKVLQPAGLRGKTDTQLEQAQNQWINAMLRLESGAAIPDSERENYRRTLLPVPNDPPEVLAQKKAAREAAFQGMISTSEGAYGRLRKQQGKGSLDGATGPLAGVSPLRRPGGPQYNPKTQAPQSRNVARPRNEAEFNRIPVGTRYVDPADGKTYVKER